MVTYPLDISGYNTIMPQRIDTNTLDSTLGLLAERLKINQSEPINMIVCGGSALIAIGLVSRATKDVDVVALMDEKGRLISAAPLPDSLRNAAIQVARDLDLDENWLNTGPGEILEFGLPNGFMSRLSRHTYGDRLTVHFIGRLDQIHFKVYAAVDRGPGYHVDDLLALHPTPEEIDAAARWSMMHDASPGFRSILKDMLKKLGYDTIAEKL